MPLDLVATPGADDANSYATVEEADAVAEYRYGPVADVWDNLDDDEKIQALVSATRDIDTAAFVGQRASDTQALEWPRKNAVGRDGVKYSRTTLPQRLVAATIELALSYATGGGEADPFEPEVNDIKEVDAADVKVVYQSTTAPDPLSTERFPGVVMRLLDPLLAVPPAQGWGTAEAVRRS